MAAPMMQNVALGKGQASNISRQTFVGHRDYEAGSGTSVDLAYALAYWQLDRSWLQRRADMFGDVPLQLKRKAREAVRRGGLPQLVAYRLAVTVVHFYLPNSFRRLFDEIQSSGLDQRQKTIRMDGIANALFTLRNEPGFGEICRRFERRDHRSVFFEASSAVLFQDAGFSIDARPSVQVKTLDFDLDVLAGSNSMAVEVTALTQEKFSADSLRNTLNSKKSQLPSDRPTAIYCYHPASWGGRWTTYHQNLSGLPHDFLEGRKE